jgi:DNA-binding transcriptional regulator YhcF (GntR family)
VKYNFDDRVRKVLARAAEEARQLSHDYKGTEHLLLGLAHAEGAVLELAGVRPSDVITRLHQSVRRGRGQVQSLADLPYTSRSKKALEYTIAAARGAGDDFVGPEHLLLGLMREQKGIAAQVLASLGLDEESAGARLRGSRIAEAAEESRFQVRVDDTSNVSIYEQIVARVQESVATGELAPGARLPTVRRLADELDIAPGTVARAYGELERLGVVVTEGARGTRIAERKRVALENGERTETLIGLLRPVVVAAFHLGATADEMRAALEPAMAGIYD